RAPEALFRVDPRARFAAQRPEAKPNGRRFECEPGTLLHHTGQWRGQGWQPAIPSRADRAYPEARASAREVLTHSYGNRPIALYPRFEPGSLFSPAQAPP